MTQSGLTPLNRIAQPDHAALQHFAACRSWGAAGRHARLVLVELGKHGAPFAPSTAGKIATLISSISPARRKAPLRDAAAVHLRRLMPSSQFKISRADPRDGAGNSRRKCKTPRLHGARRGE